MKLNYYILIKKVMITYLNIYIDSIIFFKISSFEIIWEKTWNTRKSNIENNYK